MCYNEDYFNYNLANVICREMNFTQASRFTVKESFDIQSNYDINIRISSSSCHNADSWENCDYSRFTRYFNHSKDVFLSCTGK